MSHESTVLEELTIQPVPESQRTGNVRHLFSFWFTVQIIPLAVVTGLLGPTVFGLDGIGFYFVQKLGQQDVYAVMAYLLVTSMIVIAFNLAADIVYGFLDPRIRLGD